MCRFDFIEQELDNKSFDKTKPIGLQSKNTPKTHYIFFEGIFVMDVFYAYGDGGFVEEE